MKISHEARTVMFTKDKLWMVDNDSGDTLWQKDVVMRSEPALSPDGRKLAIRHRGDVEILDAATGRVQDKACSHVKAMEFLPEGSLIATGHDVLVRMEPGKQGFLNKVFGTFKQTWKSDYLGEDPGAPHLSPDYSQAAVACNGTLCIVDTQTGAVTRRPMDVDKSSLLQWTAQGWKVQQSP